MLLLAEIMSLLVVVVVMMMVLVLVVVVVVVMTIMFMTCSHFLRYHAAMQWDHVMSANVWWL